MNSVENRLAGTSATKNSVENRLAGASATKNSVVNRLAGTPANKNSVEKLLSPRGGNGNSVPANEVCFFCIPISTNVFWLLLLFADLLYWQIVERSVVHFATIHGRN
jgi:hypothetical protein